MKNNCLVLPEKLKVDEVEEMKKSIDFEKINNDLEIDPSQVNSVDTVGMQFLISLVTKVKEVGLNIVWKSDNQLINETAITLGLADLLNHKT